MGIKNVKFLNDKCDELESKMSKQVGLYFD